MAIANLNSRQMSVFRAALYALACVAISACVWAQDITTSTTQKGPSTYETAVKSGTVVYVSGNELLVKLSDGEVEHFVVPDSQTFTVDGKQMTIRDLKPGTHLTQTITTKTTPKLITTMRTIDGKVWHVNPPSYVILTLPDGTNKEYKVPNGQVFIVNGKQDTVFQLKKGMAVSATVVKEEPVTEVSQHKAVTGVTPKPQAQVPDTVDVLLVETPQQPPQPTETTQTTQTAAAESAPKELPKTGSEWPLVGLLGLGSLGAGLLTRRLRMGWK
jgi:LPXTG-motif cell wall-anchored protein